MFLRRLPRRFAPRNDAIPLSCGPSPFNKGDFKPCRPCQREVPPQRRKDFLRNFVLSVDAACHGIAGIKYITCSGASSAVAVTLIQFFFSLFSSVTLLLCVTFLFVPSLYSCSKIFSQTCSGVSNSRQSRPLGQARFQQPAQSRCTSSACCGCP